MTTALFHQAHFIPWSGYIARCLDSDIIVFLSDVNFNKGYYHNRTKFIDVNNQLQWLTIPIMSKPKSNLLKDTLIIEPMLFKKWFRKFKIAYSNEENFNEIWSVLENIFQYKYPSLNQINQELIKIIVTKMCTISNRKIPEFYDSNDFNMEFLNKTDRLEKISIKLGIRQILMGNDSLRVHNLEQLNNKNISCVKHSFTNTTQLELPISGLSILHYILVDGWESTTNKLINNWNIINNKN